MVVYVFLFLRRLELHSPTKCLGTSHCRVLLDAYSIHVSINLCALSGRTIDVGVLFARMKLSWGGGTIWTPLFDLGLVGVAVKLGALRQFGW